MTCEVCQEREADVCNICLHEIATGVEGSVDDPKNRAEFLEGLIEEAVSALHDNDLARALALLKGGM